MDISDNDISNGIYTKPSLIERCIYQSATTKGIDPGIIFAIVKTEGGRNGSIVKNKNGSYDLGVTQINTIQFKEPWFLKRYPNWRDIVNNACVAIDAASDILLRRISELPINTSIWDAVGHYNSKTKTVKIVYLQKVLSNYRQYAEYHGLDFNLNQKVTYDQKNYFRNNHITNQ